MSLFSFSFENQLSLWYVRVMSTFYIVIWLSSFAIAPHAVWCKILLLKILTKQGNNKVSVTVKRNKYNLKSKTIWILNGAHWNDTLNLFIVKCKVLNFHSLLIVLSKYFTYYKEIFYKNIVWFSHFCGRKFQCITKIYNFLILKRIWFE